MTSTQRRALHSCQGPFAYPESALFPFHVSWNSLASLGVSLWTAFNLAFNLSTMLWQLPYSGRLERREKSSYSILSAGRGPLKMLPIISHPGGKSFSKIGSPRPRMLMSTACLKCHLSNSSLTALSSPSCRQIGSSRLPSTLKTSLTKEMAT